MANRSCVPEKLILGAVIVAWLAGAQELHPKAEIFGGYQYTRVGAVPGMNANGWNAAVTGYLNRWAGLTADFSGAYRDIAGIARRSYREYGAGAGDRSLTVAVRFNWPVACRSWGGDRSLTELSRNRRAS